MLEVRVVMGAIGLSTTPLFCKESSFGKKAACTAVSAGFWEGAKMARLVQNREMTELSQLPELEWWVVSSRR
jgi:hypothetical protein